MLTFFSDLQRRHRHPYVVNGGRQLPSYDDVARVDAILAALQQTGMGPVLAPEEMGLAPLYAVHDAGMVDFLMNAYARHRAGGGEAPAVFPSFFPPSGQCRRPDRFEGQKGFYCVDMEVPIGEGTWEAAKASASCAWTGAVALLDGAPLVYALCRPPGHHAGPDFMGGYCYLNNAAVAAQALTRDGRDRVAVLDIDYHHGNGTQAIFYDDPDVAYGSLHVDPDTAYPFFAGYADEQGAGPGEGLNRNVPLPPGTGEGGYISTLVSLLAWVRAFDPHWLVVSAGFDTYVHDPVSTFEITTEGYRRMAYRIGELDKPVLVVQEGGYYLPDLGANAVVFLEALNAPR
ncbi:MAG: histone deacetylase family protein [Anaerolineae bacterium]